MFRVQLPDDIAAFIAARTERFASEAPDQLRWQIRYVSAFKALPLHVGWIETIGMRPQR